MADSYGYSNDRNLSTNFDDAHSRSGGDCLGFLGKEAVNWRGFEFPWEAMTMRQWFGKVTKQPNVALKRTVIPKLRTTAQSFTNIIIGIQK